MHVNNPADLAERVAIVTGAGRGIGRAAAEGLAAAGCRVIATAAREPDELVSLVTAFPDQVVALRADVTNAADCEHCVEMAVSRFGRLDVLVNNAGRGMRTISSRFMIEPTKFWQADIDAWRTLIDTNVNGPFLMARAAVPIMLRAGWGRIVNISMNYETMRRAGFSPYGPSKAALESETIIWAQDLAGTGITVNALLPGGATRTGMIPPDLPEPIRAKLLDPQIIVPPLLYLASSQSDDVSARRFVANLWPATGFAGWPAR
jgi:NAD(P)-dependent dehydrogenase (short-subunit alcohol dehydrogenase family)